MLFYPVPVEGLEPYIYHGLMDLRPKPRSIRTLEHNHFHEVSLCRLPYLSTRISTTDYPSPYLSTFSLSLFSQLSTL